MSRVDKYIFNAMQDIMKLNITERMTIFACWNQMFCAKIFFVTYVIRIGSLTKDVLGCKELEI